MLVNVHIQSSNVPYGADFAALIAPVSISLFDAALRARRRTARSVNAP